jgi:IclR family transcriptional regulator, pca regulon regulatory protein
MTGISRAASRRLLSTLVYLGYMHTDGCMYRLAPKVMQLGYAYLSGQALPDIVEHYVVEVAEQTGDPCSVCVLDDLDVVYIARASTKKIMSINLSIGTRLPAWANATGRVLLGNLKPQALTEALAHSEMVEHSINTITDLDALAGAIAQATEDGFA